MMETKEMKETKEIKKTCEDCSSPMYELADTTNPITNPTNPITDPTNPISDPTNPITDPTNPITDPTYPITDPTNPITDPEQPKPGRSSACQPATQVFSKSHAAHVLSPPMPSIYSHMAMTTYGVRVQYCFCYGFKGDERDKRDSGDKGDKRDEGEKRDKRD